MAISIDNLISNQQRLLSCIAQELNRRLTRFGSGPTALVSRQCGETDSVKRIEKRN